MSTASMMTSDVSSTREEKKAIGSPDLETEKPVSIESSVEVPDGGLRAWLVVLGVSRILPSFIPIVDDISGLFFVVFNLRLFRFLGGWSLIVFTCCECPLSARQTYQAYYETVMLAGNTPSQMYVAVSPLAESRRLTIHVVLG